MSDLERRIEEAMDDYYFHPKVSWTRWPRCAAYVAARLMGKPAPKPPTGRYPDAEARVLLDGLSETPEAK